MILYKRKMFTEMIARELQRQGGVEKAFSIKSVKHLYDDKIEVEYLLLEEIGRNEGAIVYTKQLNIYFSLLLSEYKEICESLKEKIRNLEDENIQLKEENDRLSRDLQREINPYSEEGEYDPSYDDLPPYDDSILEGII